MASQNAMDEAAIWQRIDESVAAIRAMSCEGLNALRSGGDVYRASRKSRLRPSQMSNFRVVDVHVSRCQAKTQFSNARFGLARTANLPEPEGRTYASRR